MSDTHSTPLPPPPDRRRFLKWATHGMGGLFGAVLGIPAVAYLLDALNRPARAGGFKRVAKLSELQKDVPTQVVISDIRRDAWTVYPNDVVGRVWLVRREGSTVDAFTTVCPHLGCSVNFDKDRQFFVCPCHNGTFELSGKKCEKTPDGMMNPAPRDLDRLELSLVKDEDSSADRPDYFIEVKYENFFQGRPDKVVKK